MAGWAPSTSPRPLRRRLRAGAGGCRGERGRSDQAWRLARELSTDAGVRVEVSHAGGDRWEVSWTDGPTVTDLRARLDELVADDRYPALRDRRLSTSRSYSGQAWAAGAIAARRDGTLGAAVSAGAAVRRRGPGQRPGSELGPEEFAALEYVAALLEDTGDPARAADPADESAIAELLAAGDRNEYRMVRVLTNALRAPDGVRRPALAPSAPRPGSSSVAEVYRYVGRPGQGSSRVGVVVLAGAVVAGTLPCAPNFVANEMRRGDRGRT